MRAWAGMSQIFLSMFQLYLVLQALTALQVFLARGLQLEKTSKVANIQYVEVWFMYPAVFVFTVTSFHEQVVYIIAENNCNVLHRSSQVNLGSILLPMC